jgi:hypothetical protein
MGTAAHTRLLCVQAVLMARGMRRRGSARSANYKGTGENRGTAAGTDGDVELRMLLTGR